MTKLLRAIRFDQTDTAVFERAAEVGEWVVSGGAPFNGIGRDDLKGKIRQAFANGFLGISSGGRTTFATVATLDNATEAALAETLATTFTDHFGAPDRVAAEAAAEAELAFAHELCGDVPINTIFTVRRILTDAGEIEEEFRQIAPPGDEPLHARVWAVEHEDV
ncbi:MAG: DUF6505 family protein [Pseudomonadota bacterium]